MFHSVADVVGINHFTRMIFTQACGGVVGMANAEMKEEMNKEKIVALCAKGSTEDTSRMIRQSLVDAGYRPMTFHCFGFGPASLEQVIADGYIDGGVIELSNDWLDHIAGGYSFPQMIVMRMPVRLDCLRFLFLGAVILLPPRRAHIRAGRVIPTTRQ